MQVLFFYIVISFASDVILKTHRSKIYPNLTYTVLSFFTILEFASFAIFIFLIIKNRLLKKIITALSVLFLSFSLFYYLQNIGNPKKFDSPSASIEAILIIIFCIFFLFDQINHPEIVMIYESHRFWVITGFLIYMAGGLFLFIYADEFTKEQKNYYWNINSIVNFIKDIFIGVAIVMKKKTSNIHSSFGNTYHYEK